MPTIPESHRAIVETSPIVTLATIGPDGLPQVTASWFIWEDDTLKLSLNETRQKTRNMRQNPAVTAFFVDPATPYRTLELRGRVTVEEDPDYALADRVGAKYGGANLREMDQPGERRLSITLNITKVNAHGE